MNDKAIEYKIRRRLTAAGYRLVKSGARAPSFDDLGGYRIVSLKDNAVVAGDHFELTLDDVRDWMTSDFIQ